MRSPAEIGNLWPRCAECGHIAQGHDEDPPGCSERVTRQCPTCGLYAANLKCQCKGYKGPTVEEFKKLLTPEEVERYFPTPKPMRILWAGGRVDEFGGNELAAALTDLGFESAWEYPGYVHYESKRLSGYWLAFGTAGDTWAWNTENESGLPNYSGESKIPADSEEFEKILDWIHGCILVFENLA